MSRSGYSDDIEPWSLIRWRGAVTSAIRGKRGQAFLRELAEALDAMPEKRLISHELVTATGAVCAIGAVIKKRGLDASGLDPEDTDKVASLVGVADALAKEIVYENDECDWTGETPEQRWVRMRGWVTKQLKP